MTRAAWWGLGALVAVVLGIFVAVLWNESLRPDETAASPTPAPSEVATTTAEPTPSPTPTTDGWTLEQKVGQLFVVGVDLTEQAKVSEDSITAHHVGNIFLHGRSQASAADVATLVGRYTSLVGPDTTGGLPMFVSTDQEGGQVQVLQGPDFPAIPSALDQATFEPADLQQQATTWGMQLAAAGVNLNLAPVMDLVPAGTEASNPPVGALQRNYGTDPAGVAAHANAFAAGMRDAGLWVAIKHFPGLGRVTADTDSTADVTDDVTTGDDDAIGVFREGIEAGAELVMVSTAVYTHLDPSAPAAFSSAVVTDLLRGDLGFGGLVITDDVSGAEQVQSWSPADRAIAAIDAGVDLVLVSKVPDVCPEMVDAVVHLAQSDPDFAAKVEAAFQRVQAAKQTLPAP
ncbi:glycoside hydrolase family 3 N-terminal domain-containing protein [Cellulomonas composti]|uniref:beta-N-acetylhexosaminidase n=1 Tax=Cellulomonas composti TaxID=266130 RepID=A0A511J8T4_9CELL|nr:glycoside hydrolase family 3 N-terminal domain-containing protein [Cellulomonas composti]GEL94406.1 beta-N-acetylhexosaminidase [Cellulomonas composti]